MTSSTRVPAGTSAVYKVVRFTSRLSSADVRGLPVEAPATTLVHLATRPAHVSSWEVVTDTLADLASNTSADELRAELERRPPTVSARLGYLLEGVAPALIDQAQVRPAATMTHLGPRGALARYSARWNLSDSAMPATAARFGHRRHLRPRWSLRQ
jgi:hypothetical protein